MVVPAKTVQVLIIIVFVDLALLGQIAKRKSMPVIHHLVLTEDNVRIMDNSISNVIVHMDGRVKHVNSRFINAMIRINVRIMVYAWVTDSMVISNVFVHRIFTAINVNLNMMNVNQMTAKMGPHV